MDERIGEGNESANNISGGVKRPNTEKSEELYVEKKGKQDKLIVGEPADGICSGEEIEAECGPAMPKKRRMHSLKVGYGQCTSSEDDGQENNVFSDASKNDDSETTPKRVPNEIQSGIGMRSKEAPRDSSSQASNLFVFGSNSATLFADEPDEDRKAKIIEGFSVSPPIPPRISSNSKGDRTSSGMEKRIKTLEATIAKLQELIPNQSSESSLDCTYSLHPTFHPGETFKVLADGQEVKDDESQLAENQYDEEVCGDHTYADEFLKANENKQNKALKLERYLCLSKNGFVILRNGSDTAGTKQNFLEITNLVVGSGQRHVKLLNSMNYEMAASDPSGYVLGRRGWYENGNAAFIGDWQPSIIEYHPFDFWSFKNKSWWHKQMPQDESVLAVACGSDFVAALTSERLLRLYSSAGVQTHVHLCEGEAVSMTTCRHLLLAITAAPLHKCVNCCNSKFGRQNRLKSRSSLSLPKNIQNDKGHLVIPCHAHQAFFFTFLDAVSGVIFYKSQLHASVKWGNMTWVGLSERAVPFVTFANGIVLGLFPSSSHHNPMIDKVSLASNMPEVKHFGGELTAELEWVPVLNLAEATEKLKNTTYWPFDVSGGNLRAYVLRDSSKEPKVPLSPMQLPETLSLPFRLPVSTVAMCPRKVMKYNKWFERLQIDPHLNDSGQVEPLMLEYLDSVRLLQELFLRQLEFIKKINIVEMCMESITALKNDTADSTHISAADGVGTNTMFKNIPLPEEPKEKISEVSYRLKASMDSQLFKMHIKAIQDERLELAIDCLRRMSLSRTIKHAHTNLQNNGPKVLLERLDDSVIEPRLKLERKLIDQGINIDQDLRNLSFITAFESEKLPPLSIPAVIKRFTVSQNGILSLETPASFAAEDAKQKLAADENRHNTNRTTSTRDVEQKEEGIQSHVPLLRPLGVQRAKDCGSQNQKKARHRMLSECLL